MEAFNSSSLFSSIFIQIEGEKKGEGQNSIVEGPAGGELELGSVVFIQRASVMKSHPPILSVATARARPPIIIDTGDDDGMNAQRSGKRGSVVARCREIKNKLFPTSLPSLSPSLTLSDSAPIRLPRETGVKWHDTRNFL